jgi:outer membrane protein OmpA-like peptidoglycan-associated protein
MMKRLLFSFFSMCFCTYLIAQDIAGSKDHPLITRFPGSVITWYDVQAYTEFLIPKGPVTGYRHIDDWLEVSGKLTRIYYVLEGENTISEVYANYKKAIERENFVFIAKRLFPEYSRSKEVGGFGWMETAYRERYPSSAGILLLSGSATIGGSCYIAAKLERPQGNVYLTLAGSQYSQNKIVFLLDILEEADVVDDLVVANADAISESINIYGKIALYGIYFDHDKASIKPSSNPALDEIAKYLKANPSKRFYVVGHTDMSGTLEYNQNLSQKRAASVVKQLVDSYQIESSRLQAASVGPLSPIMSNSQYNGRAKNRRVELVEIL